MARNTTPLRMPLSRQKVARGKPYGKAIGNCSGVHMIAIVAWGLFFKPNAVTIVINGQQVTGLLQETIGARGLVMALIVLLCAATFLVFVSAGVGVLV